MNDRTILLGAGVDLLAADTVPGPGEGQHLDAVVGVLLQTIQLQGRLGCGHVPDLPQFWARERRERRDGEGRGGKVDARRYGGAVVKGIEEGGKEKEVER